jgi:uncharacterized membrane protein YphA (DoxX/SURF4 family)
VKQWVGLLARLVLGVVALVAGWLKFQDPAGTVRSVRAYRILPEAIVPTVGHALPMLELVLGTLLILGLFTRVAGALSALFFVAFIIGIASAWARGLEINCGCFGYGGVPADPERQYAIEILRDLGLLACSLWLVIWPRTRFSLDTLLFPQHERLPDGEQDPSAVEV